MKCSKCDLDFPRCDQTKCAKCKSREGKSNPEILQLNNMPQCLGCGLVKADLDKPLCNGCCSYFVNQSTVPLSIAAIPEAVAQLKVHIGHDGENDYSEAASAVMRSASAFQQRASDTRLGLSRPLNTNLQKAMTTRKNPLSASLAVIKERKDAKSGSRKTMIRVSTSLWQLPRGGKPKQIHGICPGIVVLPDSSAQVMLDELLSTVRDHFSKLNPMAKQLTWQNTTVYAHENNTKYANLPPTALAGTVQQFADMVYSVTGTSINSVKPVDVRFMFQHEDIFRPDGHSGDDDDDDEFTSFMSTTRKRKASVGLSGSTRAQKVTPVLQSAWRPTSPVRPIVIHARNPPMVDYEFTRTIATAEETGDVTFTVSSDVESIQISADWLNGEKLSKAKEPFYMTGFIGAGFTKRGIYCRVNGMDMCMTQLIEGSGSEDEAKDVLKAEYKLLCIADHLKTIFDNWVEDFENIVIPKFYFNFKNSIFGCLRSLRVSGGRHLPYCHFIATPLLPCGRLDARIRKFTGNGEIGLAEDNITKAIHAFVHFALVYTQTSLLLCDLQGMPDQEGTMCLIDPQSHTLKTVDRIYWDQGPPAIERFNKQHKGPCETNWICKKLKLAMLKVENVKVTTPKKQGVGPLRHGFTPTHDLDGSINDS